ncbi:Synaptotagmin-like protein 3 [Acipenser ruthenus]|uniref:Synaptotagmin-like protein 3 n=1 Tax=Acipenser ruthenus TaxID=7906 RepID=A0A444UIS5_ACIRT|nr:Synaptotagmin-like protein 3 [Acipenser ruthenus]
MAEKMDLHFLKELEREKVLEVLYRDKILRAAEEERIRKLKSELKEIRLKGTKSFSQQYTDKTCARCQKSLGKILNSGAVCKGCSHRICAKCRIVMSARVWKCTLTKAPSLPILFKKATANEDEDRVDFGRVEKANSTDTLYTGAAKRHSTCSISSTCSEVGNFENARVSGEIEFCIVYNYKTSCLEIRIKACKNLAYGDEKKKKCNPYVKTYLLPDKSPQSKLKTAIKKNTTNPTFSETLRYNIDRSQLETRSMQVSVWHSGTLKRKVFLGEVIIPLDSWKFEEDSTQSYNWYQLNSKPDRYEDCVPVQYNGELHVKVKFVLPLQSSKIQSQQLSVEDLQNKMTIIGQLNVMIIGAKNLPSLKPDGTLNSFVKGCLILPDNRQLKQKTPVLKKKSCQQWNHQLVFSGVFLCELLDSCLDITVWDHAAFGLTDRFLGGVRLERGKYDYPGGNRVINL